MTPRTRWWTGGALAFALATGCAGGGKGIKERKLPQAKPEAVEALKDAARSVRLGPANYERALERVRAARDLDARLLEAYYDEGWLLLKLKRPAEALAPLERALALLPTHAPSAAALGQAYLASGRPGEAVRAYRVFLAQVEGSQGTAGAIDDIRVALAAALRRAGKADEAIETLQKALRTASQRSLAPALNQLGLAYQAKGQLELADLVLRRALTAAQAVPAPAQAADTWNNIGLVALARRRDQEAFGAFDQAVKLDPTLTVARRNKAIVYLDCGDYGKAAEELKQVTRADAADPDAWVALGVAERGRGSVDAAERAYEKALEATPEHADARYDLGVLAMDHKKDAARAKAELERFLKAAAPTHPKVKDAEARLKELASRTAQAPSSKGGPTP